MATKLTAEGNYFILEDTVSGDLEQGAKGNVEYRVADPSGNGTYKFFNIATQSYFNNGDAAAFADIIDSGDAAFGSKALLLTFLRANTGF